MRSVIFAGILVGSALTVALGCTKATADVAAAPDARKVAVTADDKGFTPSSIDLKKGEKTQLVFTRTSDKTCATEVVFPEINLKKDLPLNKAVVIDVPVEASRTLAFQCGMGMYKSKVVIQ